MACLEVQELRFDVLPSNELKPSIRMFTGTGLVKGGGYDAIGGRPQGGTMLRWAVIFFVVALIAAAFGFLGIAAAAVGIARILFYIFLILFLISLVGGLMRRT
jgi:uncharacterized membrane protein YtjA (UPF0391 family)